jgi:hypothetical protein
MMHSKFSGHGPSGSLLQFSDDDLDAVLSTLAGTDRNGPVMRLQATCTHAASQSRGASTAAIDLSHAEVAAVRKLLLADGDTTNPGGGVDGDTSPPSGGVDGDTTDPGDGGHGDPGEPGGGGGGPIIGTCPTPGKDQLA